MYHSRKRPRGISAAAHGDASGEDRAEEVCDNSRGIDALDDMLPNILSYLRLREIMCTRRVNKTWSEAVSKTAVSLEEIFVVNSVKTYNAMIVMSSVLPNLQSVGIASFDAYHNHKYNEGEEPDEQIAARFSQHISHDIEIISNFRKLRRLEIDYPAMNGRYPFLFNSFPLLQTLKIDCVNLKWDLGMLARLPSLKELECTNSSKYMTGNISSLRVLKDTLEKLVLEGCYDSELIEGNFMDLADFPRLKKLCLRRTAVTVDFQDIGSDNFSSMEELSFGNNKSVSGNIRSLRVLKDTLRELSLDNPNVEGNFMALADFPELRSLRLCDTAVTVDMRDLSNGDFARLKEFFCHGNRSLVTGNIRNLRVLKDTLENVTLTYSDDVEGNIMDLEGNIMDLADFPQLRVLLLDGTSVTGDIRDIGKDDFSKIEDLFLPATVYGGQDYEFHRISDAPELMRALYLLKKQHPSLMLDEWYGVLSQDSPDWYDWDEEMEEDGVLPPFCISLVEIGTRIGYRWIDNIAGEYPCEVNWLDPVPDEESSDYEEFLDELQQIENEYDDVYKAYHQPPTQEEYNRLVDERRLEHER